MFIIETVRETQWHRERSRISFEPSFPNLIYFYFMPHEKWMAAACYSWWVFSARILPPPASSMRAAPRSSEPIQPCRKPAHMAQEKWRGRLPGTWDMAVVNSACRLGELHRPSLLLPLRDWMRHQQIKICREKELWETWFHMYLHGSFREPFGNGLYAWPLGCIISSFHNIRRSVLS